MDIIRLSFFFYLSLLFSNSQLLTPRINNYIKSNIHIKYVILFGIFLIFQSRSSTNYKQLLGTTSIAFILLMVALKVDLNWVVIMCICFVISLILNYVINTKVSNLDNNKYISDEKKQELLKTYDNYRLIILFALIFVVLTGYVIYGTKKVNQYGKNFNLLKFIGLQ